MHCIISCFADPARIIEPLQYTTFVVPKGQPFSIKCVATGIPSPTVYWASADPFDSFLLLPQSPPEELEIVPTEPGIYQCIAMNTVVNRDYSKSSHPPDVVSITVVVKWWVEHQLHCCCCCCCCCCCLKCNCSKTTSCMLLLLMVLCI